MAKSKRQQANVCQLMSETNRVEIRKEIGNTVLVPESQFDYNSSVIH